MLPLQISQSLYGASMCGVYVHLQVHWNCGLMVFIGRFLASFKHSKPRPLQALQSRVSLGNLEAFAPRCSAKARRFAFAGVHRSSFRPNLCKEKCPTVFGPHHLSSGYTASCFHAAAMLSNISPLFFYSLQSSFLSGVRSFAFGGGYDNYSCTQI